MKIRLPYFISQFFTYQPYSNAVKESPLHSKISALGLLKGFELENRVRIAKVLCISSVKVSLNFFNVANRSKDRTQLTKTEHIFR